MVSKREAYREYLQSPDWKAKRSQKHARSSGRCAVCRAGEYIDVHHLEYRNWVDVQMSDLRLLCRRCHDVAHLLMRKGILKFNPDMSHHARYARLKHHVTCYIQRQYLSGGVAPATNGQFRVTSEWMHSNRTSNGGWPRAVVELLGETWPPQKGWLSKQVGRCISDRLRHQIEITVREHVQGDRKA
jgi:hypothetical protein